MGFFRAAKYYYYPGWHEPGTSLELIVNKLAFEQLPSELQQIVQAAAARSNAWMLSEFEAKNSIYLQKLTNEHNVELRRFSDAVLKTLRRYSQEVEEEVAEADPMSKKVYASFDAFRKNIDPWAGLSEKLYYSAIGG